MVSVTIRRVSYILLNLLATELDIAFRILNQKVDSVQSLSIGRVDGIGDGQNCGSEPVRGVGLIHMTKWLAEAALGYDRYCDQIQRIARPAFLTS